jgi:hypothetical protein
MRKFHCLETESIFPVICSVLLSIWRGRWKMDFVKKIPASTRPAGSHSSTVCERRVRELSLTSEIHAERSARVNCGVSGMWMTQTNTM